VWIKMPYGDFVVNPRSDAVLFAGGTGITAFSAFIDGLTAEAPHSVVLAYGARTSRLFIYRDVVERARTASSMDVCYFVEHQDAANPNVRGDPAAPYVGRVSVDAVWPRVQRMRDADYYISGPPAMLQAIARDLRGRGIAGDRIHIDAWE